VLGADPLALRQDLGPAASMDGAVHSASAQEARVRRVDDGVDGLLGDVAAHQLDAHGLIVR